MGGGAPWQRKAADRSDPLEVTKDVQEAGRDIVLAQAREGVEAGLESVGARDGHAVGRRVGPDQHHMKIVGAHLEARDER